MAITFDTNKLVRTLKESGIPENQAEAFTEAFKDVQDSNIEHLATKENLQEIREDIQELRYEIKLLKWMMGFMFAGVLSLVIKAFFG